MHIYQKITKYLLTISFLISIIIPNSVFAVTALGDNCSTNLSCTIGECEDSALENIPNDDFCVCDTNIDCSTTYGGVPTDWECTDENDDIYYNLHYCLKLSTNKITDPLVNNTTPEVQSAIKKHGSPSLVDSLTNPNASVEKFHSEIAQMMKVPQTKITIPGLNFSEIDIDSMVSESSDGNTYLNIPFLGEYISAVYKYAVIAIGALAIIAIMDAGFLWVMRGGSSEGRQEAQKKLMMAFIGLLIMSVSYVLLYTINPDLVNFKSLQVLYIKGETFGYENSVSGKIAETSYKNYPKSFPEITNGQFSTGLIIPSESSSIETCTSNKKRCATQAIRDMAYEAQLKTGYPGAVLIAQYMLEGQTFGIKCKSLFEPSVKNDATAISKINCGSKSSCSAGYTWECTKEYNPVSNNITDFKNGFTIDCGVGSKAGQGFKQVHGYACFISPPPGSNIFIPLVDFYEKRKGDCFRKARDNYGGSPYAFAVEVQKCGYATAQNYAHTLHGFMDKYNLIGTADTKPKATESNLEQPINLDDVLKGEITESN